LAPKMSTVYRPNWKSATTKSYASPQLLTLDSSHRCFMRTTSGACDGEGCWSRRPCTCSDTVYGDADYAIDSRHLGAGDLRQTTPLPIPARHSNACQRSTDVCQHELSLCLSLYGILVICWQLLAHMRWSVTASGGRGFNNYCAASAPIQPIQQ